MDVGTLNQTVNINTVMTEDDEIDFHLATDYKMNIELYRGRLSKTQYQFDQLYIWVRKTDYAVLANRLLQWYRASEDHRNGYTKIIVNIELSKRYPMSIILRSVNTNNDLFLREIGNFHIFERENVIDYNQTHAAKVLSDFGNNKVSTPESAFNLGIKYKEYSDMLTELGYRMISTVESGLIVED